MLRTSTIPSSACCLQNAAVLLPSILKLGCFMQELCEQRMLRTSTIPSSACCLQNAAVLLPLALKDGIFVQVECQHGILRTFFIPSSACCLKNVAVLLPSALCFGGLVVVSRERTRCVMSTMPSSECCLQYFGLLLPLTLYNERFVQEPIEQGQLRVSTIPSLARCLQYGGRLMPSISKRANDVPLVDATQHCHHAVERPNATDGEREGKLTFNNLGQCFQPCRSGKTALVTKVGVCLKICDRQSSSHCTVKHSMIKLMPPSSRRLNVSEESRIQES